MSKPIRFLGLALCCWAGVRAVSLGLVPATGALAFDLEAARWRPMRLPSIQPTVLRPIEPALPALFCGPRRAGPLPRRATDPGVPVAF